LVKEQWDSALENGGGKGPVNHQLDTSSSTSSSDTRSSNPDLGGIHSKTQSEFSAPNWVDTRWRNRKNLTVDNTKVSADLTNFPVLIDIYDSDLRRDAQASGGDIFFTDDSGNKLNHEIEVYNRVYNSTHSHLVAWVKTNLSGSQNTVISMYYGNPTAENQGNPSGVWDNTYVGVWHLSEKGTGTRYDSTSNNNDATANNYDGDEAVTGQIDGADDFDGSNDYIDLGSDSSLNVTTVFTVEAWIKWDGTEDYNSIYSSGDANGEYYQFMIQNSKITFRDDSTGFEYGATTLSNGFWYHAAVVKDGDTGTNLFFYLDGGSDGSQSGGSTSATGVKTIGARAEQSGSHFFKGSIDEIRVSAVARSSDWIATEYNNQHDPESFYSTEAKEYSPDIDNWSFPSFNHRKNITVDASQVSGSGSLVNFPVLFNLSDIDLHDANKVQADGDDILFTDVSGMKLDHEIELFDRTGNGTHARLIAWVRIPNLSATSNTTISMYYGNTAAKNQEDPSGVWNDYTGVWHLGEDPTGTLYDSTANNNDGTSSGSMTSGDQVAGQIDGSLDFDGSDDEVSLPGVVIGDRAAWTLSAWIRMGADTADQRTIYSEGDTGVSDYLFLYVDDINSEVRFYSETASSDYAQVIGSTNVENYQWHLVTFVQRSKTDRELYVDGLSEGTSTQNAGTLTTDTASIGVLNYYWGSSDWFNGTIDEVRISNIVRSNDWITTEYNNQRDISNFYSIGSEENSPIFSDWSQPLFRYRKNITINASEVSGNLVNFPVLLNLTDSDLQDANKVQADGDDILFTDASGKKLDHEIEIFNQSIGQLIAWVRVPILSGTSNTNITMYYGNNAVNSQENPTGVWNNSYDAVWHLSQDVSDSTSNNNDGTNFGSTDVSGKIANGQNFDGVDDYIDVGSGTSINNLFSGGATISFWIKPSGWGENDYGRILDKATSTGGANGWGLHVDDYGGIPTRTIVFQRGFSTFRGVWGAPTDSISLNQWQHVVIAYDESSTSNDPIIYINGISQTINELEAPSGVASDDSAQSLRIGNYAGGTTRTFDGIIDNIQIHTNILSADWVLTEYENQNSPENFYSVSNEKIYQNWWADISFSKRKDIAINNSKVSSDLSDFPVLVDLYDTDMHDTQKIQADGDDVLFTDASGTKLNHEIELFDQAGNGTHAHLVAWVRVPDLSSTEDTTISMYYGNSDLENQESPEGVWDSNFAGVWHLKEDPSGSAPQMKDSTYNLNHGTSQGSMTGTDQVNAQIDGGLDYDGSNDNIATQENNILAGLSSFTISAWIQPGSTQLDFCGIVEFDNSTDTNSFDVAMELRSTRVPRVNVWTTSGFQFLDSSTVLPTTSLSYFVFVYDGDLNIFLDGAFDSSTSHSGNIRNNYRFINIGRNTHDGISFNGLIDEVRISTITRSADWIATEYNNQYDAASFYSVGSENVYDDTPPLINNFGVDDLGTGSGIFWAEITDIGSEVTSAKITINGTEYSMSNNGTYWVYQQSVNLTDYYTYQITNASDINGNFLTTATSEKSYTFIQDTVAPTVVDWEYYPEQGFVGTFNANVSDSWGVVDTVVVNISLIQSPFTSIDWQVMRYTPSGYINDTMDISIEDDTIYFVVTVNDTSGNSYTSPAHQDYVPNRNNAPVASNLSFVPDPPTSNESLLLTYDYTDTDSDPESGTEIRWYKNGVLQAIHDDLTTIAASYLFEGDQWNVTVRPKDGQDFGILQNSSTVTVQNGAPEVTTASVSPSSPGTTTDLTATYTYFDTDGDGENTGNREIEWFKNGQPTAFTGLALSSSNTAKGEDWSFRIRVHDGMAYSGWYQAGNVTIANTAPTASNLNVENSANLRTADNLVANWTFNDVDGDSQAVFYIIWYANGLLQPLLNNTMVVGGGNTSKGQSWYFKLIVNDGTVNSSTDWNTAFSSPSALILNTMPIADNVTITQNPRANDSLSAGWDFDDDDDDSEISAEIRWYKNGVLETSYNDQSTISSTETSKGETWNFTLRVFDGEDYSIQYNSTPTIILNTAPSATSISLSSGTNRSDEDLVASWTFDDIDAGDVQLAFNLTWYINGSYAGIFNGTVTEQGSIYTAILEYSGNLTRDDEWNFIVQVHDGMDWSSSYNSTTVTILNAKSTIIGVATFNVTQNVNTTNDLEIKYTYFDNDGDSEGTPTIYWYVNGTYYEGKDGHDKLFSSDTGKGDTWSYVIRLHDGYEYSENITSQPVDIAFINNLPSALFLNITFTSSNNNTLDDLIADYTFSDPDSGQYEYGSIIVWYLNRSGTEEVKYNYTLNLDERIANLTISASETQKGDQWWFSVLVKDGTSFTAEWKNSTLVTILNSLPTVSSHIITSTPKEGYTTDNLTASWTFDDNDTLDKNNYDYGSDFNINWYKDGVHQAGLNNKTLIENGNTTKGEYWNYTLWDGEAWSIQYNSSTIEILNTAPTAINVNIENGGNLRTNNVLKVNWTFVDVDIIDAEQAFNITWYKFVSTSYVVQSNLYNKTVVEAGNTSRFDSWKFSLHVFDGGNWSITYYSAPIQILNTAPEIDGVVTIIATSFTRGNDLTVVYDYIDADDNSSESGTEIRWYKNNVLQPALNDLLIVPGNYVFKDDTWNVSVRVSDGFDFSNMVNSTVYTINNTAPVVTSAEILYTGSLTTESTLGVSYNTSDADDDSIVEYQIIWLV
ncbi:MAG: DUF2341 domain-containing protein, partial [Candidatus Hodarchaeales archaeon]